MATMEKNANKYQKIDTIFKRDANNIIMPYDGLVKPELEYLRNMKFDASEKIDGTNIRIEVYRQYLYDTNNNVIGVSFSVDYRGKTDDANMPKHLDEYLRTTYPLEKVLFSLNLKETIMLDEFQEHGWGTLDEKTQVFTPDPNRVPEIYTIYGEGYGMKIQKGGNYIPDGVGFIVFDVKVNNIYLLREDRDEIATKLGAPIVPYMGQFTIDEAIEFVRKGFKSTIAHNKDYDAEGLVLTTPIGLKDRQGRRIIFKIKTCDWDKYFRKYGTYDKVDQPVNEKYKNENVGI